MIELKIYVPVPDSVASKWIRPRSGIVGAPQDKMYDPLRSIIYFQDTVPNSNIVTWEDCVFHAAARAVTEYPTVARGAPLTQELIEVGVFRCEDDWKNVVYEISNQKALDAWRRI